MISMTYKKYKINLKYFTIILFNDFNDLEGETGFYSMFSRGQQGVAYAIRKSNKGLTETNKEKRKNRKSQKRGKRPL